MKNIFNLFRRHESSDSESDEQVSAEIAIRNVIQAHSIEFERLLNSLVGQEILIENFEDHYLELGDDNPDLDNYGNRFPDHLEDVVEYQKLKS